jgi:hypothetical protein
MVIVVDAHMRRQAGQEQHQFAAVFGLDHLGAVFGADGMGRLSRMGVDTSPGHTAVARMPCRPSSMFRLSVIAFTPNLAAW